MSQANRKASSGSKGRAAGTAVSGQAESWLTLAERKLLDGTLGRELAEGSQKQLAATMARVRSLRDKWRDLFNRQMAATKRSTGRDTTANTRTLDKAELFAAAVKRVEARLAELTAPKAKPAVTASAKSAAPKSAAPKSAAARPAAAKPAKVVRSVAAPTTSKKARQAGNRKAIAAATGLVGYDPKKQRSAKASATVKQIKLDGLSTRRRGHTVAAGKRKQARRDGR